MDNKKIGSFIAERRKSLGLNQQQLADKLSVSNKAISKWETGEGFPDISTIPELCHNLCISTDDFFAGEIISDLNQYNCSKCKHTSATVVGNTFSKSLFKFDNLEMSNLLGNIRMIILYAFYIGIVYYASSSYIYSSFTGEVTCIWLFLGIPVLNIITGLICALKRNLSVSFFICILNGIAIVPFILSIGGGILVLATFFGYVFTTFLGIAVVLFVKNKYEIKITKKANIYKSHSIIEAASNS